MKQRAVWKGEGTYCSENMKVLKWFVSLNLIIRVCTEASTCLEFSNQLNCAHSSCSQRMLQPIHILHSQGLNLQTQLCLNFSYVNCCMNSKVSSQACECLQGQGCVVKMIAKYKTGVNFSLKLRNKYYAFHLKLVNGHVCWMFVDYFSFSGEENK